MELLLRRAWVPSSPVSWAHGEQAASGAGDAGPRLLQAWETAMWDREEARV